jgi:lysophospholipase L1-like esterase
MNITCRLLLAFCLTSPAFSATLEWQILNRYRAFDFLAGHQPALSAELFNKYAPTAQEKSLGDWLRRRNTESMGDPAGISPYARHPGPWNENPSDEPPSYDSRYVDLPEYITVGFQLSSNGLKSPPSGNCEIWLNGKAMAAGPCVGRIQVDSMPARESTAELRLNGKVLASALVAPKLRIVLGLGDSYASGEGTPDAPTKWKKTVPAEWEDWPLTQPQLMNFYVVQPARWWSNRCDRSFFSAQSMTALAMARRDPHAIVSFVHLACSGAEIIDGLLMPQRFPPGAPPRCEKPMDRDKKERNTVDSTCDLRESQLESAVKLLCRNPTASTTGDGGSLRDQLSAIRTNAYQLDWIDGKHLAMCDSKDMRPVDTVLLSIGGNDVGFAGIIAWALVPVDSYTRVKFAEIGRRKGGVVCPIPDLHCVDTEPPASRRIADLPYRYKALADSLNSYLHIQPRQVLITSYPNPLIRADGTYCENPVGSNETRPGKTNQWHAIRTYMASFAPSSWQVNLTHSEAKNINDHVVEPLNKAVRAAALAHGWRYADLAGVMRTGAWCEGVPRHLLLPGELSEWNAYADRTRMIRTANDSIATQWPNSVTTNRTARRNNQLNGTFHPNAWGYAAMADAMAQQLDSDPLRPPKGKATARSEPVLRVK